MTVWQQAKCSKTREVPVEDLIPVPTEEEELDLLARAVKMAAGYGLTSVHNMNGDIKDLRVYQKLGGTRRNVLACVCAVSSGA